MKVSNRAFADFLNISESDIKSLHNFGGDYSVITNDGDKHFVSKTDLILFIYDRVIEYSV